MDIWGINRVYINLGDDFKPIYSLDLDTLLERYARAKMNKNMALALFSENNQLRIRYTIKCLIKDTTKFIKDLGVVLSEEDMASWVSGRQIKWLKSTLLGKRRKSKVSGYSMILLHCIYIEIREDNITQEDFNLLWKFAEVIQQLTSEYYAVRPNDEIARFLLSCSTPLLKELKEATQADKKDFPDVPKRNTQKQVDD